MKMLQAAARRKPGSSASPAGALALLAAGGAAHFSQPGLGLRGFSAAAVSSPRGSKLGASTLRHSPYDQHAIPLALLQARFQSTEPRTPPKQEPPFDGSIASRGSAGSSKPKASSPASASASLSEKPASSASTSTSLSASKDAAAASSSKEKAASSSSSEAKDVGKPKEPLMTRVWAKVKHEASHYWSGTKLLGKEIKISARLQMKLLKGKSLTRREKRQVGHVLAVLQVSLIRAFTTSSSAQRKTCSV